MNRHHFPHFDQHAAHLHSLGERATAEFLAELASRIGGMPAIVGLLNEYRAKLSPAMIHAAGARRMPRHLSMIRGGADGQAPGSEARR